MASQTPDKIPLFSEGVVTLSEAAARKMKESLQNQPTYGIRMGVTGGGCSGLSYVMEPAEKPEEGDVVQEIDGLKLFIHPKAVLYLKGLRIDYTDHLLNGGFKFINPNAKSSCGCGTSFGV